MITTLLSFNRFEWTYHHGSTHQGNPRILWCSSRQSQSVSLSGSVHQRAGTKRLLKHSKQTEEFFSNWIGNFRVAFCLCFKVSPSVKPFIWKLVLFTCKWTNICMWIELISIWKASHQDSLWNRGKRQLGNQLLSVVGPYFMDTLF